MNRTSTALSLVWTLALCSLAAAPPVQKESPSEVPVRVGEEAVLYGVGEDDVQLEQIPVAVGAFHYKLMYQASRDSNPAGIEKLKALRMVQLYPPGTRVQVQEFPAEEIRTRPESWFAKVLLLEGPKKDLEVCVSPEFLQGALPSAKPKGRVTARTKTAREIQIERTEELRLERLQAQKESGIPPGRRLRKYADQSAARAAVGARLGAGLRQAVAADHARGAARQEYINRLRRGGSGPGGGYLGGASHLCGATTRTTGAPCRNPVSGGGYCHHHGG